MVSRKGLLLCLLLAFSLWGCRHKKEHVGDVRIHFDIQVDGQEVTYHALTYQNAASNHYQMDEVRFFVSDFTLISHSGSRYKVPENAGIHYVDNNLAETQDWLLSKVGEGKYDSVSFVFGLLPDQNLTGYFVNPPENNMAWPDALGGGYHYMQINGKWLSTNDSLKPFNLHTGIGQRWENGEIVEFVQNYFRVTLPLSDCYVEEETVQNIGIVMDVNEWFQHPHRFDFEEFGGSIMQNQEAQELLRENGATVFSTRMFP